METLLLARAKYLLDRVSNNVKYPTLDGSPALPAEAAALIEYLGKLGLVEDGEAMRKDFIVYFAHEVRLPNTGLDPRLVEFRAKANELFGPFLKYSRPEVDGKVVRLRLIDHFDGLRITFKKLSMLSSPLTPGTVTEPLEATADDHAEEVDSAWVKANTLWPDRFTNIREVNRFREGHPGMFRNPSKFKLEIHAGLWAAYWAEQDKACSESFDGEPNSIADDPDAQSNFLGVAADRLAALRAKKQAQEAAKKQ